MIVRLSMRYGSMNCIRLHAPYRPTSLDFFSLSRSVLLVVAASTCMPNTPRLSSGYSMNGSSLFMTLSAPLAILVPSSISWLLSFMGTGIWKKDLSSYGDLTISLASMVVGCMLVVCGVRRCVSVAGVSVMLRGGMCDVLCWFMVCVSVWECSMVWMWFRVVCSCQPEYDQ